MTNLEYLRTLSAEEYAQEMLIFRPSDACFDDGNRNYYALNNKFYQGANTAFKANLNWLNAERKEGDG